MGGRTFFQVDETTPEDQILLGDDPQCGQNTDLLCHHRLLHGRHNCQYPQSGAENLRNITDSKHIATGQDSCT